MQQVQTVLMLLACFGSFIREIKYNKFITEAWSVDLYKQGIRLQLKIYSTKVQPTVNIKEQSYLNHDEVFAYVTGLFNLDYLIPKEIKDAKTNSHLVHAG